MHYLYILQSKKDGKFYTGMTQDLEVRLKKHNAGHVKSTGHRRPFRLIYSEPYNTRQLAREREQYLKSYKGSKEKLDIIDSILALSSNG